MIKCQTLTPDFPQAIRDSFTLSTWLAIGAVVQGLLVVFVRPTFAVAPAALVLLYRLSRTMLQSFGVLRNPLMDEILMGKFSVQIGDEHGNAPTESAQQQVAVIMLGARSNQYVIPSELFIHVHSFPFWIFCSNLR